MLWDCMWTKYPRSAQGTGSDWKKPIPLARQGFLSPCIAGVEVTPGVGADVVAPSPVILGVLEHLGFRLRLRVLGLHAE